MTRIRLKYTVSDVDRFGNVRHYFCRFGKKTRLPGMPGSHAFMTAYQNALSETSIVSSSPCVVLQSSSFEALVKQFYLSATFQTLTPRSQRVRQLILNKFSKEHGHKPYKLMERRHVMTFRDSHRDRPGAATNLVKALRHVFKYAVDNDIVATNPAEKVPYLRKKNSGFHSWTIEEVEQFEATHPIGTKARLAMALLFYTGQRRSDVVRLGRQHIRADGKLHFTQAKSGYKLAIPIISPLRAVISATSSTGGLTFLITHLGASYTPNGFGNAFRAWCNQAGLPHCSAHGLRKALGARLAELGATTNQLKDALGHLTLSELARYTRAADQSINAETAFSLLENEQTANENVPLSAEVTSSGTTRGKKL